MVGGRKFWTDPRGLALALGLALGLATGAIGEAGPDRGGLVRAVRDASTGVACRDLGCWVAASVTWSRASLIVPLKFSTAERTVTRSTIMSTKVALGNPCSVRVQVLMSSCILARGDDVSVRSMGFFRLSDNNHVKRQWRDRIAFRY